MRKDNRKKNTYLFLKYIHTSRKLIHEYVVIQFVGVSISNKAAEVQNFWHCLVKFFFLF